MIQIACFCKSGEKNGIQPVHLRRRWGEKSGVRVVGSRLAYMFALVFSGPGSGDLLDVTQLLMFQRRPIASLDQSVLASLCVSLCVDGELSY